MKTEFEVKICQIDPTSIVKTLQSLKAKRTQPKTLFKRLIFKHPTNPNNAYIRVRDEWSKITCTSKVVDRSKGIDSVQEVEFEVSDFDACVSLLMSIGLSQKAYQETYREIWYINMVQITIDERPWLKPFIEIEWPDQQSVEDVVGLLGYKRNQVVFWAVDEIYYQELGVPHQVINNTPSITFDQPPQMYQG